MQTEHPQITPMIVARLAAMEFSKEFKLRGINNPRLHAAVPVDKSRFQSGTDASILSLSDKENGIEIQVLTCRDYVAGNTCIFIMTNRGMGSFKSEMIVNSHEFSRLTVTGMHLLYVKPCVERMVNQMAGKLSPNLPFSAFSYMG